jgi:hypothetical protein
MLIEEVQNGMDTLCDGERIFSVLDSRYRRHGLIVPFSVEKYK